MSPLDLKGQTFGKWEVLKKCTKPRRPNTGSNWVCRCACGTIRTIPIGNLRGGKSTQCNKCGAKSAGQSRRHPYADHPLFKLWRRRVRSDCVPRWKNFLNFAEDVGEQSARNLRKLVQEKPLGPTNFKWSSGWLREQDKTEVCGIRKSQFEWAEFLGITKQRVNQLVKSYGSLQSALESRAELFGVSLPSALSSGKVKELMSHKPTGAMGWGRKPKYPWHEWTNGEIWRVQASDYGLLSIERLRSVITSHAQRFGFSFKTRTEWENPGVLVFQFFKEQANG